MFGLLKDKLKSFINGLVKKEEAKPAGPAESAKPTEATKAEEKIAPEPEPKPVEEKLEEKPESAIEEAPEPITEEKLEPIIEEPKPLIEKPKPVLVEKKVERPQEKKPDIEAPKRELKPKLGLLTQIKSFFSTTITISENEVTPLLSELELALLESDVSIEAAQFLTNDLRKRLVGKQVAKNALDEAVRNEVRTALLDLLPKEKTDFIELIENKKKAGKTPFVILFLGPNGSGKTTTIAKIASRLKEKNISAVISASDSFRAAAIEQAKHHGDALGVRVVKHDYGADPTAVAFDAVAHAKANGIDVVLIDTAGRQETNYNLVKEMEKMNRVLKPDLRVFVGEAIAGNALVNQVREFNEKVGVDALVLTKLDCDAKGGSAFSTAFEIKKPILFVGVGQEYADLREFDSAWLVENVLAG